MRLAIICIFMICIAACSNADDYQPRNGDIVFQTSLSSQSVAVQKATGSKYSHMGIVYMREGNPYVFEAIEPVQLTPLDKWIKRGKAGRYVAKRLKQSDKLLTPQALARMKEIGDEFKGKHYDLYFGWSDDRIYCSELVWKIYNRALDIEVGELSSFGDFDLSDPEVKALIKKRYGDSLPLGEIAISPAAMFDTELLETVYNNTASFEE